jgi:hypothetical protein
MLSEAKVSVETMDTKRRELRGQEYQRGTTEDTAADRRGALLSSSSFSRSLIRQAHRLKK